MNEAPEREGGDITAADMILEDEGPSSVQKFYAGSTIFLTGGTGYLGKMCLEKLLRDCGDLKQIYVMVRAKKGKDVRTRFEEIFDGPNMEPLKRNNPNYVNKVTLISGDCALPNLGLSPSDQETLIREVNCIIHCAATVRFDEKLRIAAQINIKSVMDLIKMAKQMRNLKAMVYVSTAFSNCVRKKIDEEIYPSPIEPQKLMSLLEALDDDKLEAVTPIILGDYPNTYVFTKSVAENVIKSESKNLPVVVYRPSIVIPSLKEPVAGWIDNFYGATGIFVGAALGLLRSLHGNRKNAAEMVPADYVVNCALVSAWDVANTKSINDNEEDQRENSEEVPVYNFVSRPESEITWDTYTKLSEKHGPQVPTTKQIWAYFFEMRPNRLHHQIAVIFFHKIPAYIVDFLALCMGKKPLLVKGYQKIDKFAEVISYFSMREWEFSNKNVQKLWLKMDEKDKTIFEFSMKNFDWANYFHYYVRGARIYLLKDPLDTIPEGRVKYWKLKIAHYLLIGILALLMLKLLWVLFGAIF